MDPVRTDKGEQLAAQAHIWNHIFNFVNTMSLKCAVELGISDIIHKHGQPMSFDQLIQALPINPAKSEFVYNLMRILTHSGFFRREKIIISDDQNDEEEKKQGYAYSLTASSMLLLKNHPASVAPFVMAMLDPQLMNPWHYMSQWFQNSTDANTFLTCHGKRLWELASCQPQLNQCFNQGMASDSRLIGSVLTEKCLDTFSGLNSMVDVGGGTGTMAEAIADALPNLKCTVLDLPHVVDGLKSTRQNLEFVGGDMFEAVPSADAILLKWIIHSLGDKESIQLLKTCKEAIPNKENGGKVIIIDMVIAKDNEQQRKRGKHISDGDGDDQEETETKLFFDMLMLVVNGSKERDEEEWAKLFFEAGFTSYNITPRVFGLRSLIQVYY